MKSVLSVRGAIAVLLLIAVALSAGTALAGRQSAVSSAVSLTEPQGASIVTSATCVAPVAADKAKKIALTPAALTVWGSGWANKELILLSLIIDENNARIWFSGEVNESGATEIAFEILPPGKYKGSEERPQAPTATGVYTLEAVGSSGRLATAPLVVVTDKCPTQWEELIEELAARNPQWFPPETQ